jgi:hypothetical protein
VVIDGYKRIGALEQLGRDTVEAVVWPMSEAAAVLLDRSLRLSEQLVETALCVAEPISGRWRQQTFLRRLTEDRAENGHVTNFAKSRGHKGESDPEDLPLHAYDRVTAVARRKGSQGVFLR